MEHCPEHGEEYKRVSDGLGAEAREKGYVPNPEYVMAKDSPYAFFGWPFLVNESERE